MGSRLPPFKSIEAFVVAARALSFTEAASALHITLPAVSRRIQALESDLGVALFQRKPRTLLLTQAGESYLSDLEPAIETIRRASQQLRGEARPHTVKISLPASLAANWLLPRLSHFHIAHRGIHVELESGSDVTDFNKGESDIMICFGHGNWPGVHAERLLEVEGFLVCSPSYFTDNSLPRDAKEIANLPLLGVRGQLELWVEWFRRAGFDPPAQIGQEFDTAHLLYQAAACGLGIALGIDVLVQPYLDQGQLVRPFNSQFSLSKGYYLVHRAANLTRKPVFKFRDWLRMQAANDTARRANSLRNGRSKVPMGRAASAAW